MGSAPRGRSAARPVARVEAPRVVAFPLCPICSAPMIRLELKHIADRWPSCPSGGWVGGVYVCPGVVPGADPVVSHDWDQEALAFYPHLLNRPGSRVYGWHIQTCFWEDVREKALAFRERVRQMIERLPPTGPVRQFKADWAA